MMETEDEGEPPIPELVAEFDALHDLLHPMIKATEDGQGETVRMTINVPKQWAMLAAWLEIKGRMRRSGDLGPMRNSLNMDPRLAHWQKAKGRVEWAMEEYFHHQLHLLATHWHPYLYPPPPPRPARQTDLDDDFPF